MVTGCQHTVVITCIFNIFAKFWDQSFQDRLVEWEIYAQNCKMQKFCLNPIEVTERLTGIVVRFSADRKHMVYWI